MQEQGREGLPFRGKVEKRFVLQKNRRSVINADGFESRDADAVELH